MAQRGTNLRPVAVMVALVVVVVLLVGPRRPRDTGADRPPPRTHPAMIAQAGPWHPATPGSILGATHRREADAMRRTGR